MLFTDIEGSTRLAARLGSGWPEVLAVHHELVGEAIAAESGFVDGIEGDAFFATFVDAGAAARAAVASLTALRAYRWSAEVGVLAVRMGLHVGYVERRATGYVGLELHRAARVAAAAHGGQLLLTGAACALVGEVVTVEPLGLHRLKDFPSPEPLFCAVVDGRGAAAFPPPRTESVRPTNLPAGRPALVGRDDELEHLRRAFLVEGERLVTLVGRGGMGKTTLALVAARELLDEYSGGVWLVRLASAVSTDDVLRAVAAATDADGDLSTSSRDLVVNRLRRRGPVLVVLDNFEHLPGATPAVGALLDEVPELRLLVTSQAPLRLGMELCLPLGGLDHESALALVERVSRRRGASLGGAGDDRTELLQVVDLLDGLPLGLELAAARLRVLSPAQVLDRLRESPDLLDDAGLDRPDRQRSLRATVQWTLGLLADDARAVFIRMGAFAGPVELRDLEAVVAGDGVDMLETLASLLEFALVRRVESGDGAIRFELPEALRQIASGLLDAATDGGRWRAAHARHQCDLVWAARTVVVAASVFRRASAADAEVNAALRWARSVGDPLAARLAAAHAVVLADNGRGREAAAVVEPVLAQPTGQAEVDGLALSAHAFALAVLGRIQEALVPAVQATSVSRDLETRTFAFLVCGLVRTYAEQPEASVHDLEHATELARNLGPAALAGALLYTAQARMVAGDLEQARKDLSEAVRIGRPVDAKALFHVDTLTGDLAVLSGRPMEALEPYARSLEDAQARGDQLQIFHDLSGMANVLAILHHDEAALEVDGIAEAQAHEVRGPDGNPADLGGLDAITAARERTGATRAAHLRARGRVVSAGHRVTTACRFARAVGGATDTPA